MTLVDAVRRSVLAEPKAPSLILPLARYRAHFVATETVSLPRYAGSAWRGAFGHALKQTVCVTRQADCVSCLLYRSCAYPYLFETPLPVAATKMRKYPAAPHPFTLELDGERERLEPGDSYQLGFTLFGRGNQYLPYMVLALERAAARGVGRGRGSLRLGSVEQETAAGSDDWQTIYVPDSGLDPLPVANPVIPALPAAIRVTLDTALRLKSEDQPVTLERFTFGTLFAHLLRRISMLTYFHTETPLEADFSSLTQAARSVSLHAACLDWREQRRYSSRQERHVPLGGLTGVFHLDGRAIEPFWPFLWLGQYTHAGAASSMGLGAYRIHAASLPDAPAAQAPRQNTGA